MNSMKFIRFFTRLASLQALVFVFTSLPTISCHAQDSAGWKLVSEYRQDEQKFRSRHGGGPMSKEERRAYSEKWRVTFSKALEELRKDDPERINVLWEAALLAHQAGDHNEALKLSDEAAHSCTKPNQVEQRAYMITNAAMVAWDAYVANETHENLDRSMKRFTEARPLLDNLGEHYLPHGLEFLQKFARASQRSNDRVHERLAYQAGIEILEKNPKAGETLLKSHPDSSFSKEWFQKKLQELKPDNE